MLGVLLFGLLMKEGALTRVGHRLTRQTLAGFTRQGKSQRSVAR
jgi:hypothetical protein